LLATAHNEVLLKIMKKLLVAKPLVGIALAICLIPVQAHAASPAPGPKLPRVEHTR
jgi:hypothetical protein